MKNKAVPQMVQCSLFVQATSLKGCVEDGTNVNVEQDNQQQFYLTLLVLMLVALCNWVYNHWNELAARLGPRGRKRRRNERGEEEPEPEVDRTVVSNDNIEPGTSQKDRFQQQTALNLGLRYSHRCQLILRHVGK